MRSYDPKHASPMISSHSDCFRALNAPFFCYHKFHIFAIKAQNYHFVSKISQIFYFQNLKLARLKTVTKSKALTCTMRSYDPKQASPMISRHSDCFRALTRHFSPTTDFFFSQLKAQKYHFSSKISRIFYFRNLKLVRLKSVTKSIALTYTRRSYDRKEAPNMISTHSDCFRALNAHFFSPTTNFIYSHLKTQKYHFSSNISRIFVFKIWNWRV